jgi:hypothetical protein
MAKPIAGKTVEDKLLFAGASKDDAVSTWSSLTDLPCIVSLAAQAADSDEEWQTLFGAVLAMLRSETAISKDITLVTCLSLTEPFLSNPSPKGYGAVKQAYASAGRVVAVSTAVSEELAKSSSVEVKHGDGVARGGAQVVRAYLRAVMAYAVKENPVVVLGHLRLMAELLVGVSSASKKHSREEANAKLSEIKSKLKYVESSL